MPTVAATPTALTTLAQTVLVSPYKPILVLVALIPWAWVVSRVLDKHAAQFHLARRKWNLGHMGAGFLALIAMLGVGSFMPGAEYGFWIGWVLAILILAADVVVYMQVANKDERVPERHRVTFKTITGGLFAKKQTKKETKEEESKFTIKQPDEKGKYSKLVPVPAPETPEMEVRAAAEALYDKALRARATQVDFAPAGADGSYAAKFMVDGVTQTGETYPAPAAAKLMDFWKAAAGLDVSDRRRKLQGVCQVEDPGAKHIVRVTSIGAQGGMRVTLLFDPDQAVARKAEELGLLPPQLAELKTIVDDAKGVVLLAAPRDQGRSTLLYAVMRKHDAYINNVQTVEVEPQGTMEGVRINKFDAQAENPNLPAGATGPEFSTLTRSILRRDPQVVGVGELPDAATAKELAKADHERTRSYVSFNAPDALSAVQVWVKNVGDTRLAGDCLHGVAAGRLVRKLCTNCRVPYQPAPDMLKKLGLPEGKVRQLFKKGGQVLIKNKPETCPMCQGSGYFGQEGVYEVASLGREERELITAGNYQGLKAALRKRNIPTIQQVAISKAVAGVTSVEEVMRVTTEGGSGGTGGGGGAAPAPAPGAPTPAGAKPAAAAKPATAPTAPAPAKPGA